MSIRASQALESSQATQPPQFGLRTLLLSVTAISVVLAVFVAVGPAWSAMLALAFSLIGLHVAGNAIGTRLCENAPQRVLNEPPTLAENPPPASAVPVVPAARRLQENTSVDGRCWIAAALGVVIGAGLGGACVSWMAAQHLTWAGLLVGILSSAMLGGLFCFLASSLLLVARTAWQEALQSLDDAPPGPHAS